MKDLIRALKNLNATLQMLVEAILELSNKL
nr:MAG TPA: hypothetical protein [Caudoviricetes sp.]